MKLQMPYISYDHLRLFGHRGFMPRAFKESEREKIRKRLMQAGEESLRRGGVKSLVIDDIARAAGISKGSFYSFFPSREDFILSVFEAWEVSYRGALFSEILDGEGSPRERLERFILGALRIFEREPMLAKLGMNEISQLMDRLPPERMAAHQAADAVAMKEAIGAWLERGLISAEDVPALGGVMASLFAIAIQRKDFPEGSYEPAIRLIAEAMAMRLSGRGA
jgi:AcrR family transcriptional regulator